MKNLLFAALLLIVSCRKNAEPAHQPAYVPEDSIPLPGEQVRVDTFKIKDYRAIIINPNLPDVKISTAEVVKADALLLKSLAAYNKKQEAKYAEYRKASPNGTLKREDFVIDLRYYARQYIPQLNEKGEKEVIIIGMCTISDDDLWKKHKQHINDGGDCYFDLMVNLSNNTFGELFPNGEA